MKESPHFYGHRKRLRDRFAANPASLADYEVLELLLGYALPRRDTKPMAKELLARFGTVRGAMAAGVVDLAEVKGLGPGTAMLWDLIREVNARVSEAPVAERTVLSSPEIVARVAMERLGTQTVEQFWVALVDNKNRLMSWEKVSQGTVDQTAVYPREVLGLVLARKASGLVMVHNHPGGDPTPSKEDVELTRRMHRAANDLGVRLLDHLVVADNGYFSFQQKGLL